MIARHPRRRRIDIYFVLYLMALVLLLPDGREQQVKSDVELSSFRLELQPERVRLEHQLRRDTSGVVTRLGLDSINTIRFIGDVDDLRVSARIEDVLTGQVLTVEPGSTSTSMFAIEPRADRHAILFRWRPSMSDLAGRTFRVTLTSSGQPKTASTANRSDESAIPAGIRVSGTTQFVLATVVENEQGEDITKVFARDTVIITQTIGSGGEGAFGEFWLGAEREKIEILATREWTNRIVVGGADAARDLVDLPRIAVSGDLPGDIQRSFDAERRAVLLKGKAPRSGVVTIDVTARRKDGAKASTSFVVAARPLDNVDLPDALYPGMTYSLVTRLPDLPNSKAQIREGSAIRVETTGDVLRFTPSDTDTNRTIVFERLIDGVREGSPIPLRVRAFPGPEIVDVKEIGNNRKRIVVIFWGDKEQNRPQLSVVDGNCSTPKKLYGQLRPVSSSERPTLRWYEEFEVERKDVTKPFSFRIQARDGRGYMSPVVPSN